MPGDIDPNSDPPTDAQTAGVAGGGPLRRLAEKAAARRDTEMRMRSAPPASTRLETVLVVPVDGRTVYDINGIPYPPEGRMVTGTDTYAHRRVRDGSLSATVMPASAGTLVAEEVGEDILEATGDAHHGPNL